MSPAATADRASAEIIVAGISIADEVVVISGQNPRRNLSCSGRTVIEHHQLLWFVLSIMDPKNRTRLAKVKVNMV